MSHVFSIDASALPHSAQVMAFRGHEALSKPYRFEVFVLVDRASSLEFDMEAALGQRASLRLHRDDGSVHQTFHGVLDAIELVHELPGDALYRLELAPKLWGLSLSHHNRVFVGKTVPEVLEAVLRMGGLHGEADLAKRLERTYRPVDHICQYNESDLAFVSRWMEREGIYYYFEHNDAQERLVLTDTKALHEPLGRAPVRFVAGAARDHASAVEALTSFTCQRSALPSSVQVRDHDYLHPDLDVSGSQPVAPGFAGEMNYHGDNFATPAEGRRLAALRAEEQLARRVRYHGAGRAFELRAGYLFDLDDHPRPAFNARYLVTAITHEGNLLAGAPEVRALVHFDHDDVYRVSLDAIPAAVQYRAPRSSPSPRIYGTELARVCGAGESNYAQIDEHGRYKVKIHFDEGTERGGRASTWVRMLQPHGGSPEGFHFPLRKGTEVLLVFLGGDPDRPVISGVVPDAHTPSPVTRGNSTFNVIHTGGDNRLEMQDSAGAQHVDLSSPTQNSHLHLGAAGQRTHNFALSTDGEGLVHTGSNLDVTVDANKTEHVVGDVTESYDSNQTLQIGVNFDETYGANNTISVGGNQEVTVQGDRALKVMGDQKVQVLGDESYTVLGDKSLGVTGSRSASVTGADSLTVMASQTQTVLAAQSTTVLGGQALSVVGGRTVSVTGDQSAMVTGAKASMVGADESSLVLGSRSAVIVGTDDTTVMGPKSHFHSADALDVTYGATMEVFAGIKVGLKVGVCCDFDLSVGIDAAPFRKKDEAVSISNIAVSIELNAPRIMTCAIVIIA
jgi:type VI secretion system secreted protein VgrG